MPNMTPLDVIVKTRDWLTERKHWCQGSYGGTNDRDVMSDFGQADYTCLIGGIMRTVGWQINRGCFPEQDEATSRLYINTVQAIDRFTVQYTEGRYRDAMSYNDNNSHPEVLMLLDNYIEQAVNKAVDREVIPPLAIEPIEAIA